jgi:hypothetical protein
MFNVETDPQTSIIKVVREGFFTLAEMQQSVEAVRAAIDAFGGERFRLLADFRAFKPATPEVAAKLSEILMYTAKAERIAHLLASSVMLLQIRRLARRQASPPSLASLTTKRRRCAGSCMQRTTRSNSAKPAMGGPKIAKIFWIFPIGDGFAINQARVGHSERSAAGFPQERRP